MSSIGLNIGLRALLSSRLVLDTVGNNIANSNTEGYSRQRVQLGASLPINRRGLLVGTGVEAGSIQRASDSLLARRILGQVSLAGNLESVYSGLTEVESLIGGLEGNALGDGIDSFFSSVSELATAPDDPILRTGAVQSTLAMTSQFNLLAESFSSLDRDVGREIEGRVRQVNELTSSIAELNVQIGQAESTGLAPNDLQDRRDLSLKRLAELVDIQTVQAPGGAVNVLAGGKAIVTTTRSNPIEVRYDNSNRPILEVQGTTGSVDVGGGSIGGLLELTRSFLPDLTGDLDRLARNFVLAVNRVHSTGIPASGPFSSLTGSNRVQDLDGDGQLRDELLSNAGLPFDVSSGSLFVNVTDTATGEVTKSRIDISKTHTTVGDFLDDLNALPNVTADLDGFGRLRVLSDTGFRFDFSPRIDFNPDAAGTFGSDKASLGTSASEPFALTDGDTISLTADPSGAATALTITLSASDFQSIGAATAEEIAAAINADPNVQANGLEAEAIDGRLFLLTAGTGAGVEYRLDGGSALGSLGWNGLVGTTIQGQDNDVDVTLGGQFTGNGYNRFSFSPNADGVIGTTPNLTVDVMDSNGQRVATLDVGAGYVPGTELEVGDGLTVRFGLGELSATNNDYFSVDLIDDSDTSDVLVALGMNSLLVGDSAETIGVRGDIELDPSLLATSHSGSSGDTSALLSLLSVEQQGLTELGGRSLGGFFGEIVGDVGFDVSSTLNAIDSNAALVSSLEARQQQISGVNVDEELVDLLRYEQSFAAASQYISVVNQINDELLNILL